jgi:hypothetical protein
MVFFAFSCLFLVAEFSVSPVLSHGLLRFPAWGYHWSGLSVGNGHPEGWIYEATAAYRQELESVAEHDYLDTIVRDSMIWSPEELEDEHKRRDEPKTLPGRWQRYQRWHRQSLQLTISQLQRSLLPIPPDPTFSISSRDGPNYTDWGGWLQGGFSALSQYVGRWHTYYKDQIMRSRELLPVQVLIESFVPLLDTILTLSQQLGIRAPLVAEDHYRAHDSAPTTDPTSVHNLAREEAWDVALLDYITFMRQLQLRAHHKLFMRNATAPMKLALLAMLVPRLHSNLTALISRQAQALLMYHRDILSRGLALWSRLTHQALLPSLSKHSHNSNDDDDKRIRESRTFELDDNEVPSEICILHGMYRALSTQLIPASDANLSASSFFPELLYKEVTLWPLYRRLLLEFRTLTCLWRKHIPSMRAALFFPRGTKEMIETDSKEAVKYALISAIWLHSEVIQSAHPDKPTSATSSKMTLRSRIKIRRAHAAYLRTLLLCFWQVTLLPECFVHVISQERHIFEDPDH